MKGFNLSRRSKIKRNGFKQSNSWAAGDEGMQFGPEVFCCRSSDDLPLVELGPLSDEVFACYSGPDEGLAFALDNKENNVAGGLEIAGSRCWNQKDQKAYGICISLYEQHPVSGKMSGDPVADAFAICARQNNCVMLIADGVNWGEKSRLAARCALYGSMMHIHDTIFKRGRQPTTTHEVFEILRRSFDEAHQVIMDKEGGLTTLCACFVCPVKNSGQFAVCCLNVGDSYGYVFSHNQGIREVTQGSHDVSLVRDIRDAGGALGPVDGQNPELHNMTYGLTFSNQGDIVFLTTDGISDNYDPVVTKIALPNRTADLLDPSTSNQDSTSSKPEMEPKERHIYSMKEMERIVHEFELVTEEQCSAQEMCSAMVQHVLLLTDPKRKVLENPDLYTRRRLSQKDKKRRDSEIVSKMSEAPGKLDHASIVAYEVGVMKTDEEEMECIPLLETTHSNGSEDGSLNHNNSSSSFDTSGASSSSPGVLSPASKKSRPKKLFSKIRSFSSSSNPSSPSTENNSGFLSVSPKKFSFKRPRSRQDGGAISPMSPPPLDGYRFPKSPLSPSPMSPGTTEALLPMPVPYRSTCNSLSFESSV